MRLQERVSGTGSARQRSHKSSGTLWGQGKGDDRGRGRGEEGVAVIGRKTEDRSEAGSKGSQVMPH